LKILLGSPTGDLKILLGSLTGDLKILLGDDRITNGEGK
jgi:hypothetical protein